MKRRNSSTGLPSLVRKGWEVENLCTNGVYVLRKLLTNGVLQQNLCSNEHTIFRMCQCANAH